MKRPVQLGIASMKAVAAVVAFGAAAHAAIPYLPLLGPPPLRLLTAKHPAAPVVKFVATPAEAVAQPPVVYGPTNSLGASSTPIYGPPSPAATDKLAEVNLNNSVFALPAQDLVGISPQALAAFFRPVLSGTNIVAPVGLLPLSFVPPVLPDKSSHAEYNIK
jgi:hypothetical protein